ncbi:MAG: 2TM domain-containing protein [Bacteroidota bacterium]
MEEQQLYLRAKERVRKRRKFYSHAMSWVVMSVFFILLNLATSDFFWAIFPILGWGLGVAFHAISIFSYEWEDTEVDREYERLRKRRQHRAGIDDFDLGDDAPEESKAAWQGNDFV